MIAVRVSILRACAGAGDALPTCSLSGLMQYVNEGANDILMLCFPSAVMSVAPTQAALRRTFTPYSHLRLLATAATLKSSPPGRMALFTASFCLFLKGKKAFYENAIFSEAN